MRGKQWYKVENAGKLYGSIINDRATTFYRFSATLKEPVNVERLNVAFNRTLKQFPYYNVKREKGFFWHYFSANTAMRISYEETFFPCTHSDRSDSFPLQVIYFNNRISLEIMHVLTDGSGAINFLKALIISYFTLENNPDYLLDFTYDNALDKISDGFKQHHKKRFHLLSEKHKKAMHLPFKQSLIGQYFVTTGTLSIQEIKAVSKRYGATVTEYLLALYFDTIFDYIKAQPYLIKRVLKKRPVSINVPVDLRHFYESRTVWNFFISIVPSIETKYGYYEFDEIIEYVKFFLKTHTKKRYLNSEIKQVIQRSNRLISRLLPLFIKDLVLPFMYSRIGEKYYTSGFSNLGIIKLDESIANKIEKFDIYPPPSQLNKIKVGMISFQNTLSITFGSLCDDTEIEKLFFRKLILQGVGVKIESNREE